ncbi:hypothetical protein GF402_05870 [Candidatus Fermentibacteria bacterium]|nr:hypothetical protein [Candidatus Fermentibacteria bacterium]
MDCSSSRQFSFDFGLEGDEDLLLRSLNGSVDLRRSTSGRLEVTVTLLDHLASSGIEKVITVLEEREPFVVVRSYYQNSRVEASVDYDIAVPESSSLSFAVEVVNGSLSAEEQGISLSMRTCNGSISGSGLTGPLRMETRNGSIRVKGKPALGSIRTLNGDVEAEVGSIEADGARVSTRGGEVRLLLADSVQADLVARAYSGEVVLDDLHLENLHFGDSGLAGRLGGGGARLYVENVSGKIVLSSRIST